jgi:hypothetical protein
MNLQFNDRIIDDQGNVKTLAGGQDARLYYMDINGTRKKYLLEGEAQGGEGSAVTSVNGMTGDVIVEFDGVTSINGKKGDVQLDLYKIDYESYSGNDIKLEANKYFTNTNALTSIDLNITNINNAMCVFKTGETVSFTVSVPENMLVNKAFNFEANKNYIIAVDNGIVFWSEVVAAN